MSKDEIVASQGFAVEPQQLEETAAVIADNMGDDGISINDLERIKVPAGGGLFWEVPDDDGEVQSQKELTCIIVGKRRVRGYWRDDQAMGNPPDCASDDSKVGVARTEYGPGGTCATCPMNRYPTDEEVKAGVKRGKACKERIVMMVLTQESRLPVIVSIPPTSLKNASMAMRRLSGQGLRYFEVIHKLTLQPNVSADGNKYAKVVFTKVRNLSDAEKASIKAYADAVMPVFTRINLHEDASDYEAE